MPVMPARILAVSLTLLACAATAPAALAADGDLDAGFASAGARIDQFALAGPYGSFAQDLALRADGRPVAVVFATGADALTKLTTVQYTTAGGLDASFATGGVHRVAATPVLTDGSFSASVAVLSDDRVLSGGSAGADTLESPVLQLDTAGGSLDTSFGSPTGGIFFPDFGGPSLEGNIAAIAPIAGAGAIAVGTTAATGGRAVIAKIRPNGTLDPAFNTTGFRLDALDRGGSNRNGWSAVAIAPDGKIVVVGETNDEAPGGLVAVVGRFTSTGAPDTTFGPGGLRYVQASPLTNDSRKTIPDGVAVLPDGRIVVGLTVAYKQIPPSGVDDNVFRFGAARLTTTGGLDPTFAGGGVAQVQPGQVIGGGEPDSSVRSLVVQPSGRVILGGAAGDAATGRSQLTLVRLTAAGAPDPSFGDAGIRRYPLGGTAATSQAIRLALTPGQLLYAAGQAGQRTLLARFTASTPPVATISGVPSTPAGNTVTFDASGSKASDGGPLTYSWDLNGDGAFGDATGPTASKAFAAGTYAIAVRATDDNGLTGSATRAYTADAPVAKLKSPKASLPASATVTGGTALVRVACARGLAPCTGTVTLYGSGRLPAAGSARRAAPVYGRATFTIKAGKAKTVRIKLSSAGRRALGGRRSLRVTARAVTRRPGRTPTTVTRTLTLRRR